MVHVKPVEVAIVGGGCAGVTAAFELTRPEHRGRYHVTLYQQGWRLGGKGASGRGPSGRIEEHGLHVWMGFYENAFRLLRECYSELGREPGSCPITDWDDAFYPHSFLGLADRGADGQWLDWTALFPAAPGNPGDPLTSSNPFTVRSYMVRLAAQVRALLISVRNGGCAVEPGVGAESPGFVAGLAEELVRAARYGQLATFGALIEAVELLKTALGSTSDPDPGAVVALVDRIAVGARNQLEAMIGHDDELRRLWQMMDVIMAILRGALRCRLMTDERGFDAIDDYDWRDWLCLHGASRSSVDSAFVRGSYDLLFAYEDGDPARPRLAAGQALRGAVRMFFGYRGALFWKMRAGMGDIVFAPLFEVLQRRGVDFRFFHRLEEVGLASEASLAAGDRAHVRSLRFAVQAEVVGGAGYRPLVDVRGLPCWPSGPDYAQLVGGAALKEEGRAFESFWDRRRVDTLTLEVTRDFDFVVLGVGIGEIPHVCAEIVQRDPRWRRMVDEVKTVPTQALQLWMKEDVHGLGWQKPEVTLSGYVKPFDTWADMGHLLPYENWSTEPRSIAYFCSVLADRPAAEQTAEDYPGRRREEVRHNAVRFLNDHVGFLWPGAVNAEGGFRWELLCDAEAGGRDLAVDEGRLDTQFWTANVNPTDRYVLSLPGSLKHRISPLDMSYDNLTIAGDWTGCGHQAGCVEAAVMAGRLAAHAIAQSPPLEEIIGYDHP